MALRLQAVTLAVMCTGQGGRKRGITKCFQMTLRHRAPRGLNGGIGGPKPDIGRVWKPRHRNLCQLVGFSGTPLMQQAAHHLKIPWFGLRRGKMPGLRDMLFPRRLCRLRRYRRQADEKEQRSTDYTRRLDPAAAQSHALSCALSCAKSYNLFYTLSCAPHLRASSMGS